MKQVGTQEILFKKKKKKEKRTKRKKEKKNAGCGQTLEQSAQKGSGVSIFGDIQKSHGHSPEQSGCAFSEALDKTSRGPEKMYRILLFFS